MFTQEEQARLQALAKRIDVVCKEVVLLPAEYHPVFAEELMVIGVGMVAVEQRAITIDQFEDRLAMVEAGLTFSKATVAMIAASAKVNGGTLQAPATPPVPNGSLN